MDEFNKSLFYVQQGPKMKTSNEQKLKFYSLYKQIKSGDNNTQAPSRFNFIEKAKWFFLFY
jgi:acyl-CoA-binding protein